MILIMKGLVGSGVTIETTGGNSLRVEKFNGFIDYLVYLNYKPKDLREQILMNEKFNKRFI